MCAQSPRLSRKFCTIAFMIFCSVAICQASNTVNIHPGDNIPNIVAQNPPGTTFVIYPGTYRLTEPIQAQDNDTFIGQSACAPPKTACTTILSGSRIIGSQAKFNGTYYEVTGQTQQNSTDGVQAARCQPSWSGCMYPEDLYFDGVPLQHLNSSSLPTIPSGRWWFDYPNNTIYFHDNPSGHVVETSVASSAFGGNGNNVTIQYLTIKEFASSPGSPGTIGMPGNPTLTQGINWKVKNCEILLNHGYGVRAGYGMQILNNYVHNNGWIGVGGGMSTDAATRTTPSNIVIANNVITYNNYAHFLPQFGSGGIKFTSTKGVVIRGNTITNNDGAGIHADMSDDSPTLDGNLITDNTGGGGIEYEVSLTSALIRNNVSMRNGADLPTESGPSANIGSYASVGVDAYCNVMQMAAVAQTEGFQVVGSNRGYNPFPPGQYLMSTGNSFHHNTLIWEPGAGGVVGYLLGDAAHQPNFFSDNTPPDYNMYHMPSLSMANFVYDNNTSQKNTRKTFAQYQNSGADVHGTADTKYNSGFPNVKITSPADGSTVGNSVTVNASATDGSGIDKVEFFVDWTLKSTVTSSPYSFNWNNIPAGTHTVTAMAYSNAGIGACYAVTLKK
jgi:parallel beta-helix repeat protein